MKSPAVRGKACVKVALLSISLMHLGTFGISPILSDVAAAFPGTTDAGVQWLSTIPFIFIAAVNLLYGALCRLVRPKALAVTGMSLLVLSGAGALICHSTLTALYLWAALLGVGMGLYMPVPTASAAQYYEGGERAALMGQFSVMQSVGGIALSLLSGWLAASLWYRAYAVYALGVPVLLCMAFFLPTGEKRVPPRAESRPLRLDRRLLCNYAIILAFSCLYGGGTTNASLLIAQRQLGDASTAGIASCFMLLAGAASGMLFGRLNRKIGWHTIPAGFLLIAVGFLLVGVASRLPLLLFGFALIGAGRGCIYPQVSLQIMRDRSAEDMPGISAWLFACGTLGAFLSPLITLLAAALTGSGSVVTRMLLCCGLTAALTAGLLVYALLRKRNEGAASR